MTDPERALRDILSIAEHGGSTPETLLASIRNRARETLAALARAEGDTSGVEASRALRGLVAAIESFIHAHDYEEYWRNDLAFLGAQAVVDDAAPDARPE